MAPMVRLPRAVPSKLADGGGGDMEVHRVIFLSTMFYIRIFYRSVSEVLAKCLQSFYKVFAKCFFAKRSIDMLHVHSKEVPNTQTPTFGLDRRTVIFLVIFRSSLHMVSGLPLGRIEFLP